MKKFQNHSSDCRRAGGSACTPSGAASSPRIVIRGESPNTPSTLIDYLSFTVRDIEENTADFPLKGVLTNIFNIPPYEWIKTKTGWNGYTQHIKLNCYGEIGFGGVSQRNTIHVAINGRGCFQVPDWQLVHDWLVTVDASISRIDLAHDAFQGGEINIEKAIEWDDNGLFNSSGRPPETHLRDDRGSGKGKTFYVGNRESSKYLRIYEKGKKQGDKFSPWVRAEVEIKKKDRQIPLDVLIKPGDYLAGTYPALSFLSSIQSKIKTRIKEKNISLNKATRWARSVCGQLINLLCILENENYEKVINTLRRPGIPKKLTPYYKQALLDQGKEP